MEPREMAICGCGRRSSNAILKFVAGNRIKVAIRNWEVVGYNRCLRFGGFLLPGRILADHACTGVTSVDCCDLPAKAEIGGAEAVSVCADAGAAVPLQPGVRGVREDSVSAAHPEEGTDARRMLQGGRRVRDPDGVDSGRRAADALAD